MSSLDVTQLLRAGLLDGISILLAKPGWDRAESCWAASASQACRSLGASVTEITPEPLAEEALDRAVSATAEETAIDLLVVDSAGIYTGALAGEGDGLSALRACMDSSWNATRAAVNLAFLKRGQGGRIVYLAPTEGAGPRARAARAGLENLARTTSVEWARHQITAVAITAGQRSSAEEVAALVAYLASPAGAYFSGCLLDMRGPTLP